MSDWLKKQGMGLGKAFPYFFGVGAVIILVLFWKSFYIQLEDYERGVVFKLGKFTGSILGPGAHGRLPYPLYKIHKVDVQRDHKLQIGFKTTEKGERVHLEREALTLTRYGNLVELEMEVNYHIEDPAAYVINVDNPDLAVKQAAESGMRMVVGLYTIDDILTGEKRRIVDEIKENIQGILASYGTGITINRVQFIKAVNPKKVLKAFENVENAKQDSGKAFLDAQRYSNQKLPEAEGQAQRQIEEAKAYAATVIARAQGDSIRFVSLLGEYQKHKKVTRKRLYLEAMEEVLPRVKKIIVDGKSGTSNILPLGRF